MDQNAASDRCSRSGAGCRSCWRSTAEKETDELETTAAEAATRCEPLKSVAARLARLGGDRKRAVAHRDRRSRTHTTGRSGVPDQRKDLAGPLRGARGTMSASKNGRNQTAQQGPSPWPIWMITDSMLRNAFVEETERSCTMRIATPSTMPVAKQDPHQNEK